MPDSLGYMRKIVLEGDRGHRLVLGLDLDALLRLDRLVQAVRPAATVHHASGKLVDDDDLVVLDDVVDVACLNIDVRLQRLVEMVDDLGVLDVVEVAADSSISAASNITLDLFDTIFGQR